MDAVPALGEHTDAILAALGYSPGGIASCGRQRPTERARSNYLFVPGHRPERFAKAAGPPERAP